MEVPNIFKRLGLAEEDDVWVIVKVLYQVLPTLRWTRSVGESVKEGRFVHPKDENLWRLIEVDVETGEEPWEGLMSVYVDDILIAAGRDTAQAGMAAIEKTWATSKVEWASDGVVADAHGDGFHVSQRQFKQEFLTRWNSKQSTPYPIFKVNEADEEVAEEVNPNDTRTAQMLTGALLWVSIRTRPDLVFGLSAMSRLVTRNPVKAIEIGYALLKYLHGNPGMHFPKTIPGGEWGHRPTHVETTHEDAGGVC